MNRPTLMGILNVTPDSFSGGGQMGADAIAAAKALAQDGADIIDIGAESTRPGALPITPEEEWVRLAPVLEGIANAPWRAGVRLSVDTRHAPTAARALELGVEIINDVGGLRDAAMVELLGEHDGDIVVMHALSLPVDPALTLPPQADAVAEIMGWKSRVVAQALAFGIAPERLIYDPGIGFGKTPAQSLDLMLRADALVASGGRWLFGHSRKSFLTLFTDAPAAERDALTRAFSAQLAQQKIPYLRVHDIAGHRAMFEQLCI